MKRKKSADGSSHGLFGTIDQIEQLDHRAAKTRKLSSAKSISKSLAARAQSDLSTELLGCRILFQRALSQIQSTEKSQTVVDDDDDTLNSSEKSRLGLAKDADELLSLLLEARQKLCGFHPNKEAKNEDAGDFYSSIISKDSEMKRGIQKALEPSELDDVLSNEYSQCAEQWKEVLNRRHYELRLRSGLTAKAEAKFRSVDKSFWEQVQGVVEYEQLQKQLRQRQSKIDEDDDQEKDAKDEKNSHRKQDKAKTNKNNPLALFDDSRVYQNMLRDFVALGSSSDSATTIEGSSKKNSAELAAERLQRAARKKSNSNHPDKDDVDRRASKGRKIRYIVNEKLQNFCFPVERPTPDVAENEWFKSLFGGAITSTKNVLKKVEGNTPTRKRKKKGA